MRLLGIDLETTGLDFINDEIIEVGIIVKDTGVNKMVHQEVMALMDSNYPIISDKIYMLTKITVDHLLEVGLPPCEGLTRLVDLCQSLKPDYIVAHNGNFFDRPFLRSKMAKYFSDNKFLSDRAEHHFWRVPWIDTRVDIPFGDEIKTRRLIHLAAEHGFLNPFPHDALSDVQTMFKILEKYPLDLVIERAADDTITIVALVDYGERQLAKDRGYYWDPKSKQWLKTVKAKDAAKEKERAPFDVAKLVNDAGKE